VVTSIGIQVTRYLSVSSAGLAVVACRTPLVAVGLAASMVAASSAQVVMSVRMAVIRLRPLSSSVKLVGPPSTSPSGAVSGSTVAAMSPPRLRVMVV
jgi:hypothetical protein